MATPPVILRRLGRVEYSKALALQVSLAAQYRTIRPNEPVGELLLCEHDPVYTLGLREKNVDDVIEKLRKFGANVYKTRRGGLTTFHGPGQLLAYPVLNMRALRLGVRDYVRRLEGSVITALGQFGVQGFTTENVGVWVRAHDNHEKKICALGIQVSQGVCYHGLALNCCIDLSWFKHITPCGLVGKEMTSLLEQCGRQVTVEEASSILVASLSDRIGFRLLEQ